jgi:hypothetical protein
MWGRSEARHRNGLQIQGLEASVRRHPWIKGSIDDWFQAMSEQIPSAPLITCTDQSVPFETNVEKI